LDTCIPAAVDPENGTLRCTGLQCGINRTEQAQYLKYDASVFFFLKKLIIVIGCIGFLAKIS